MKQPPRPRPLHDERDRQIQTGARSFALEIVIALSQILTVVCAIKGNSAWRGTLSLLFLGCAAALFDQYRQYREKPYCQVASVMLLFGAGLLGGFVFGG